MRAIKKILIVGFGDIGKRVARLLPRSCRVYALVRKSPGFRQARRLGVRTIHGDLARRHSLHDLGDRFDTIFHFAPPPGSGRKDTHTRHLLDALKPRKSRPAMLTQRARARIVYISTTGVYGDHAGGWVDEGTRAAPSTTRGMRRLDAESAIVRFGKRHRIESFILRAPGIYASDRLPVDRIRNRMPALAAGDDVYTNHIHADDLANICVLAMATRRSSLLANVVDDSNMRMGEYFDAVADAFAMPRPPRVSREEARHVLPPAMYSFMSESRRIRNARMKRWLGSRLRFPTVHAFLAGCKRA